MTLVEDSYPDGWIAEGTLAGLEAGSRTVRRLELRGAQGVHAADLAGLSRFPELEEFVLVGGSQVDLTPLADQKLLSVELHEVHAVDLAPLSRLTALCELALFDVTAQVPNRLELALGLQTLIYENDDRRHGAEPVRAFIEAVDWSRHGALKALQLVVEDDSPGGPIRTDLNFLRDLTSLESLRMEAGVLPDGPSPLDPPFDGLPKTLKFIRISAEDPEPLEEALAAFIGARDPAGPRLQGAVVYDA